MNTIKSILKKLHTTEQLIQPTNKTIKRITFNQNIRVRTLKSKEDISNVEDYVENINDFATKDNVNDKNLDKKNTKSNKEKLQSTKTLVMESKAVNIAQKENDSIKAVLKALILEAEVVKLDEVIEILAEALELVKESVKADTKADAAIKEEEKAEQDAKKTLEELKEENNRELLTIEQQGKTIEKILVAKQACKRSQEAVIEATEKREKSLEALSKSLEALAKAFEDEREDLISLFTPTAEADTKEKLKKTFNALVKAFKEKNADMRSFCLPVVEAIAETKKVEIFKTLEQVLELEEGLKSLLILAVKAPTKEEKVKALNVLAKSVEDYDERDDYSEKDHSLMFACETKLSGNYLNLGHDDAIAN